MNRIIKVSCFFKYLFWGLCAVCVPFQGVLYWWGVSKIKEEMSYNLFGMDLIEMRAGSAADSMLLASLKKSSILIQSLGFAADLLPALIIMFTFYSLTKLFSLFQKGHIFTEKIVKQIQKVAYSLIALELFSPVQEVLFSLIATWENPSGDHYITISFTHADFVILLVALLTLLISWIMNEGRKLQDDLRFTV